MATKIYVTDPQFSIADPSPDRALLCYSINVWTQGLPPVPHAPCGQETIVSVAWGESGVSIQQKVIDNILANFPDVSSNDIVFLGAWL